MAVMTTQRITIITTPERAVAWLHEEVGVDGLDSGLWAMSDLTCFGDVAQFCDHNDYLTAMWEEFDIAAWDDEGGLRPEVMEWTNAVTALFDQHVQAHTRPTVSA